jgi:ribosomal protein S18 acetylase RimI-like enzyme
MEALCARLVKTHLKAALLLPICCATPDDAPDILALQKLAYQSEAKLYNDWTLAPLVQDVESLRQEFSSSTVLKAELAGRLVGSVRARAKNGVCCIGRLIVHPDFQGRGIGSSLLTAIEAHFNDASAFELFTGAKSAGNIRLYQRHGYALTRTESLSPSVSIVFLTKTAHTAPKPAH